MIESIDVPTLRRFLRLVSLVDGKRQQNHLAVDLAKSEGNSERDAAKLSKALSDWHVHLLDQLWPAEAGHSMSSRRRLFNAIRQNAVEITRQGLQLAEYARQVTQAACRFADQLADPSVGHLKIYSDRTAIERVLGPLLKDYLHADHGDEGFRYIDIRGLDTGREMVDTLLSGQADIAIWMDTAECRPGGLLAQKKLLTFRRSLIVSDEYCTSRSFIPSDNTQLANQTLLTFRPGDLVELQLDGQFPEPTGRGKRVYLPSSTHMLSWCLAGVGVAMGVIEAYPFPDKHLRTIRADLFPEAHEILYLYYRSGESRPSVVNVITHLAQAGERYGPHRK